MINLLPSAEWPLAQGDIDWLRDNFAEIHNAALANIRFSGIVPRIDPLHDPATVFQVDVELFLRENTWIDSRGRQDAGLYTPASGGRPARIEITWPLNWSLGGTILSHEIAHFILFINAAGGWDTFGHGMNAPPPKTINDHYLAELVRLGRLVYPLGYSSDPFRPEVNT